MRWYAISFGALDVTEDPGFQGTDILVNPTIPMMPLALSHGGSELWRRLAHGGVEDDALSVEERAVVLEMEQSGIVTRSPDHPNLQSPLSEPWLDSALHELTYALVSCIARVEDIDLLFFKGPMLHAQGLRDRSHSGDVDAWVRFEDLDRLSTALRAWGWSRRTATWVNHSVTLFPGEWGCELDIHHRFPGVEPKRGTAFDVVKFNSEKKRFASIDALVPEKSVAAVISALHLYRPEPGEPTPDIALQEASDVLVRGGTACIEAARSLGAAAALEPVLRDAFPQATLNNLGSIPQNWSWRMKPSKPSAYIAALKAAPPGQLFRMIWRTIWPTSDDVLATDHAMGGNAKTPLQARVHRVHSLFRTARG